MGTKLTEKEREGFEDIIKTDLGAIQSKVVEQIEIIWKKGTEKLEEKEGYSELRNRREEVNEEIKKLEEERHQIQQTLNSEDLTKQQIIELGGKINKFGEAQGGEFYGIPISSQFEYNVVQYIKKHIDLEVPAKFLHDLARSCYRELTMEGTFEGAKKVYEKLYALDFRKYGVDIPPRLADIKAQNPTLEAPKELLQIEDKKYVEEKKE